LGAGFAGSLVGNCPRWCRGDRSTADNSGFPPLWAVERRLARRLQL